ncbi:MAG: L-serine ammonia-lyase, iron-sulfur-dependent, subunit alpha [Spirochaetaceae bacterium]|jgi:L-serine dehydratase|nr:L-serine ammonia-lyase, iron-sulfur-dependent, subunit alpha [Spirochaetaceae bacterium]
MLEYNSVAELIHEAENQGRSISGVVIDDQAESMGLTKQRLFEDMRRNLDVMRVAARNGTSETLKSRSGLSGGNGFRMTRYAASEGGLEPLSGAFCAVAMSKAIAIAEYNAAMGRIVAAPTAGSCGILPAAILTVEDFYKIPERKLVMSLFTAGGIGLVVAKNASIAGAEGGCQAECGSAAALAAAALVELRDGDPVQAAEACAIALKNQLGLVCDPVAGLVEVPCIKRNAGGVMCAIAAADMALAGIKSMIPVDEVISAMREIGDALPASLRETALGGLAATLTGQSLKQKIFG